MTPKNQSHVERLGLTVLDVEGYPCISRDELRAKLGKHYAKFAELMAGQTSLAEGPFLYDVEVALDRLATGRDFRPGEWD